MRISLNIKYLLSFLVFGLCCFLCISTVTSQLMMKNAVSSKADAFYREGLCLSDQYVVSYFEAPETRKNLSTVQSHLTSLDIYLNADIWLISRDGEVILDSGSSTVLAERRLIPEFNSVLPGGKYYMTGDFFGMYSEETLSVLIPVSHNYHVRGYIAIHTPMSVIVQEKEGYLMSFYITMILLLVMTFLFAAFHWLMICLPIYRMQKTAMEYALGNYNVPVRMNREDELGFLADTMDFMAESLKDHEEDQRKLISNISHDFRSPLTSIKGYIEAMLDGTIPFEMQEKCAEPSDDNICELYAATRNALYRAGKKTEILVNYNPKLHYFGEWWKQLYGESEGKDHKGIFPAAVDFSTDLHSMGQWIQDGERTIFETVISVEKAASTTVIPADDANLDGLNYIAGKRVDQVNKMAELGTRIAHVDGGVPNIRVSVPELSERYLGQLIYFFELSCGISGYLLGVNPFNQPGVEDYKRNMFALLEKPGYEEATKAIKAKL